MPTIVLKSKAFDAVEAALNFPGVTWDNQAAVEALANLDPVGKPQVLQLSASLIRLSQSGWDYSSGLPQFVTYELRLSGSGISPVSTIDALIDAINNGLAVGTLGKLEILQGGTGLLAVTMDASGYTLASGDVSVKLAGALPLTLSQFGEVADLFGKVVNLDALTRAERADVFRDLTAYSVTGLTLTDGGKVLFSAQINATTASLTLNGLTLTATGSFPSNLGQDIEALWNLLGSGNPLDVTGFDGVNVTGLRLTDAKGRLLGSVADPLADTPTVTRVDGKVYDHVEMGGNGDDWMSAFTGSYMIAGLGGADSMAGGTKADLLMGGGGDDTMAGFGSADRLDGGTGRDVLTGGAGADVFHFDLGDGRDRITDFTAGQDVIEILDAVRLRDLVLTKVGHDVRVDFQSVHILVEGVTLAELSHGYNFQI